MSAVEGIRAVLGALKPEMEAMWREKLQQMEEIARRVARAELGAQSPIVPKHDLISRHTVATGNTGDVPTLQADGTLAMAAPTGGTGISEAEAEAIAAAAVEAHEGETDPHTGYVLESREGQANGIATLGADGKVPSGQLPASSGGHAVYDETTLLTARSKLRFLGAGVSAADNAGEDATDVTISGTSGGSSDGDGKPLIWGPPASANAKDDEFNDATGMSGPTNGLNARWSKRNLGTSSWLVLDDAKAPGCLLFDIPAGQSVDQHIYQAVPSGDFSVVCRIEPIKFSDRQIWVLAVVDTNGNGIGTEWDPGDQLQMREITNWTLGSGSWLFYMATQTAPATLALRKAGTTYWGSINFHNIRFRAPTEMSNPTWSGTAAYITFGRIYGSGSAKLALECFRVS